ncbi:hypothetical protein BC834DRAFT_882798 [Gloeopeniophorella convolvens]|nr:hypothetical protein BC834DRAFT_882798 [Gloeopeniophorella convolvens]
MFNFFSSDRKSGPNPDPTNESTASLSETEFPGGPSPDTSFSSPRRESPGMRDQPLSNGPQGGPGADATHNSPGVADRARSSRVAPRSPLATQQDFGGAQPPRSSPSLPPQPPQHPVIAGKPAATGGSPVAPVRVRTPSPDSKPILRNTAEAPVSHPRELSDGAPPGPNSAVIAASNGAETKSGTRARRSGSVVSRRSNRSVPADNLQGSTFANGAATATSEPPDVHPMVHERMASAENELAAKDRAVIHKEEHGLGRKLSKVVRSEGKAEKAALQVAMKELAELQKMQKASIKEESTSHSKHSRALSDAHKAEMDLLAARNVNEREQTSLRSAEEALEASRRHARETTEMLREKMEEVERLRAYKQMDDRERVLKVKGLVGDEKRGLSRILGSA